MTPPEPGCEPSITFEVVGYFPDGCWEVTGIEFTTDNDALGFVIHAVDHWQPGTYCTLALVEYWSSEVIETPPSGNYWAVAVESVQSLRDPQGDSIYFPLLVCCPGTEAPVTDLRLEKVNDGARLRFTWSDVPGAETYHLFGDDVPDGTFEIELGRTTDFSLELDTAPLPGFFLLSQSSACNETQGQGVSRQAPLRSTPELSAPALPRFGLAARAR